MAPNSLHASFRWLLAVTLLGSLGLGCSKSKDAAVTETTTKTAKVSGKVTYSRIPLLTKDTGEPIGLETDTAKFTTLPARFVQVRLWVAADETSSTGEVSRPWHLVDTASTDAEGAYSFNVTYKAGTDAFVELTSVNRPSSGGSIRIVADPAGIESAVPQSDRLLYILRKGVGGKLPEAAAIPGEKLSGDATVDFAIGQPTAWWLNSDLTTEAALNQAVLETTPTGSRVLAIIDSLTEFATSFTTASLPGVLDLHYRPGVSHPRGSFIEYDRSRYPKAYAPQGYHFFGSLQGGVANDDAWDRGVIATLAAQNFLFASHTGPWTFVAPVDRWSADAGREMVNLHPTAAFHQGAVQVLAALALKTPYLADTVAAGAPRVVDIRQVGSAPRDAFSAPNLRALAWELMLKANSLPSPGTPTDWAKLTATAGARYFAQVLPKDSNGKQADVVSVFGQLARLKEDKAPTESVDLKAIFTDDVIKGMAAPYGLTWPRPTTGPLATFLGDWGTDFAPDAGKSLFTKTLTFSMAQAVQDGTGLFSNASRGETVTVLYATTKDQAYFIDVTPLPPDGTRLEINIANPATLGGAPLLKTFDATLSSSPTDPLKRTVFLNTTKDNVTSYLPITVHLVSPSTKVPDYTFTLTLRPTL